MKQLDDIYRYCTENSENEPSYLQKLRRETHLKTTKPHMVSGPLQGQLLKMLVQLLNAKCILEIGTFTGYASLCLASGLGDTGKVYTVEKEEEYRYYHLKYFPMSGLLDKIECIYGDANKFVEKTDLEFDFVFMDAGKKDYKSQIEVLIKKLTPGGVILADNVLWKNQVLRNEETFDKMTRHLHEFNRFVKNDPRLENIILPLRDGLNLIRKK